MYLLDTNVISETVKDIPNPSLIEWLSLIDESQIFLSVLTLGEIRKGIEKPPNSAKKQKILVWLEDELIKRFCDRIINIDVKIADKWGYLTATQNIPAIDALIAASAIVYNLKLITRNIKDFQNIVGLEVINPWV